MKFLSVVAECQSAAGAPLRDSVRALERQKLLKTSPVDATAPLEYSVRALKRQKLLKTSPVDAAAPLGHSVRALERHNSTLYILYSNFA